MRLILSSKKGKLALFLLIIVVLAFINMLTGASELSTSQFSCGLIIYLRLVWLLIKNDIRYLKTPAEEIWKKWDPCSSSEHQQRRMMRANTSDITIKEIDKENRFGIFVGERTYRTTLESCTCPDFKERKLPCKHMYRLASELGLIELPDPDFKN